VVSLELAESAADAAVLREEFGDRVSGRVGCLHVAREVLVLARVYDTAAELFIAAGLKSVNEETDVFEDHAANEQTAGQRKVLVFQIPLQEESVCGGRSARR
jgi:hypothetical protein